MRLLRLINSKALKQTLIYTALALAALHILVVLGKDLFPMGWLLDLDSERNVPTVYTGLLLIGCSIMCYSSMKHTRNKAERWIWAMLAGLFAALSVDEVFVLHERVALPIRQALSIADESILYHAWVIPAIALTALIGFAAVFLYTVKNQKDVRQRQIIVLTFLLAGGVIVLEIVGTKFYFSDPVYKLGPVLAEEMLEIFMISVIFYRLNLEKSPTKSKKNLRMVRAAT